MANTLKGVAVLELTASYVTIYTVPALTKFTVGMLHICNRDTSQQTVTVLIRATGTDVDAEAVVGPDFPIEAKGIRELLKGAVLEAGWLVRAKAGVTQKVNVFLTGIETTT